MWFFLVVLCVLGYLAYNHWDAVLTGAIVLGSIAAVGVVIFYGTRSWLAVEYVSPIATEHFTHCSSTSVSIRFTRVDMGTWGRC